MMFTQNPNQSLENQKLKKKKKEADNGNKNTLGKERENSYNSCTEVQEKQFYQTSTSQPEVGVIQLPQDPPEQLEQGANSLPSNILQKTNTKVTNKDTLPITPNESAFEFTGFEDQWEEDDFDPELKKKIDIEVEEFRLRLEAINRESKSMIRMPLPTPVATSLRLCSMLNS